MKNADTIERRGNFCIIIGIISTVPAIRPTSIEKINLSILQIIWLLKNHRF